ncbi:tautomerase family protein [Williamsia sterculiae]|uniref:Phenylpyruvate tautomerase PptA, 4-oxalocrotonate tautomerase family n=1 Tax=Williamsia sterculiae TaxID=1344003 RepID=A0A1N7FHI3_9NOCA|nr:tautomerase family protein [Williamsia sterculiae]SIR99888.1 Phenylpyruvate tautomerase PptA, 4-oxalocrotonate tautomerase family [Williamsia sterculiae]
MPMWTIHHTPGTLTDDDKSALASDITDHYAAVGLPRFYVIVVFHEVTAKNIYVGGIAPDSVVRISIDHIARRNPDEKGRRRTARWVGDIVQPHLDRAAVRHWEFHIDETSDQLWMINGLVPPPGGSDAEQAWAQANQTSRY